MIEEWSELKINAHLLMLGTDFCAKNVVHRASDEIIRQLLSQLADAQKDIDLAKIEIDRLTEGNLERERHAEEREKEATAEYCRLIAATYHGDRPCANHCGQKIAAMIEEKFERGEPTS